ncbi:MAG: hypothetical protein ACI4JM_04365, partial [Oscillospiraceae bacterium]
TATKGSAFGNRQLFEKSWAKTFGFVTLFTDNSLLCGSTALIRLILQTGGGNLPKKAGQKLLVSLLYLLIILCFVARPL